MCVCECVRMCESVLYQPASAFFLVRAGEEVLHRLRVFFIFFFPESPEFPSSYTWSDLLCRNLHLPKATAPY